MKKTLAITLFSAAALTPTALGQVSNSNPFGTTPIDTSGSATGVVSLNAGNSMTAIRNAGFTRYTNVIAPNGNAIHIAGQAGVSEAQLRRARGILEFYLNSAGTAYGPSQKAGVANTLANRNATLLYTNVAGGIEEVFNTPGFDALNIAGQDLGGNESPTVGSSAWLNNTTRDASFEEIFHLVHGHGIQPALPAYQNQIQAAQTNARPGSAAVPSNIWTIDTSFYNELAAEGSLTHEYIISAIDVYYGLWAHDPNNPVGSFHGEYTPTTRENLATRDPMGLSAVQAFMPATLNYTEYVDASFTGTFSMTPDASQAYTLKSQYFRDVVLTGSNHSNLTGNDLDNLLGGNAGNNTLDGGAGTDTALFTGARADYTLTNNAGTYTVTGADGTDTLINFEFVRFSDQTVALLSGSLPGDYNSDGQVTAADYTVWADTFGSTTDLRADGNGDGSITAADYTVWADNFGSAPAAPGSAVPEPASLVLIGLGGLLLVRGHR